jgi:integrase
MHAARRKAGEVPELAGEVRLVGERELRGDETQGRRILGAYRPQRSLEPREPRVALQSEADLMAEQRAQRAPVHRKPCGNGGNAVALAQSALRITDQLGGAGAGAVCPHSQGPFDAVEQQRHPRLRAGIDKLVTPHTLRHAFITAALDAGVPLRDVQEAASHADPRTTMRYDRARGTLDRHATYIVAAYVAGAAR